MSDAPWSKQVRDRWFYAFLAMATLLVLYLFSSFAYVLLFASVVVVVTWPLYQWVLRRVGERPLVASVLTTLILVFAVFGPIGTILYLFVLEAVVVAQNGSAFVTSGQLEDLLVQLQEQFVSESGLFSTWVAPYLPEGFDPVRAVAGQLENGAVQLLNLVGTSIPDLLNRTVGAVLDVVIFVFSVITLYMEGPRVLTAIKHLSPMDDVYEERLFAVFGEFANNMVVGSLATASVQGLVAALGYGIAGVDRIVFLGIVTALCSFVPLIGTLVVWLPVALVTGLEVGWGLAAFIAFWNLAFTGTIDNLIRPLFLRGSSNIHPLLIFLAVFGGLQWLGLPGVLIGPVLVAMFLALYTIYLTDFLGVELPKRERAPSPIERWIFARSAAARAKLGDDAGSDPIKKSPLEE